MLHRTISGNDAPDFEVRAIPTVVDGLGIPDGKVALVAFPADADPVLLKSGLPKGVKKVSPYHRASQIREVDRKFYINRIDEYGLGVPMVGFCIGHKGTPMGSLAFERIQLDVYVVELYRYDQQKNTIMLEIRIRIPEEDQIHTVWLEIPGPLGDCLIRVTDYITFLHSIHIQTDVTDYRKSVFRHIFGTSSNKWYGDTSSQVYSRWLAMKQWMSKAETRWLGSSPLAIYLASLVWFSDQRHVKGAGRRAKYVNMAEYNKQREFKTFHEKVLSAPFINRRLRF